jgi:hypothetical protein
MNASFSGSTGQCAQEAVGPARRIGDPEARGEVIFRSGRNPIRNCLTIRQVIARHEIPEWRPWEGLRLHTGDQRGPPAPSVLQERSSDANAHVHTRDTRKRLPRSGFVQTGLEEINDDLLEADAL